MFTKSLERGIKKPSYKDIFYFSRKLLTYPHSFPHFWICHTI